MRQFDKKSEYNSIYFPNVYIGSTKDILSDLYEFLTKNERKSLSYEDLECCSSIKTNVSDIDMEILTLETKINEALDNKDKKKFMSLTEQLNLLLEIKESQKLSALVF